MEWKLFADLSDITGSNTVSVDIDGGATVGDALDALFAAYPDLEDRVLDEEGTVAEHINLLHNGTNVFTQADGLDTPVEEGDELALFPPVTGG